jgi:cyclophilin family peptidyl-prolyl cis-trans isomerase
MAAATLALTPLAGPVALPPPAAAVLNSPNAQIARSADVALRRAIPGNNGYMRSVQSKLESIQFKLRIPQRKPWGAIAEDATSAAITMGQVDKVLEGTPAGKEDVGRKLVGDIQEGLRRLKGVIDQQDPGKVSFRVADVLRDVGELEILQAPGLPSIIPREYADLPHLTGRATVELTIEKQDGSLAYVTNEGGGPQKEAHLTLVLDGYSAPLTAGNFVRNVLEGAYTNAQLKVDQGAVLAGGGAAGGRTLPLEMLPIGQFDIVYRSPLDVRSGELPVLPLSIYGALAMSHGPDGADSAAADEFFIYKFDRQSSGLAGLSFDEGEFGVFGYVTQGTELIPQLGNGDIITGVRLTRGGERLVNAPATIAERAMKASVMYGMP